MKNGLFIGISFLFSALCTCAFAYDLNNDGYDDIIFSNSHNDSTVELNSYIYWGSSDNSYSSRMELATVGAVGNTVADLNSDGYFDIVFSNIQGDYSYIYWGDATNQYSQRTDLETSGAFSSSVADLNEDGYLDIVFANHQNGTTKSINSYIYWGSSTTPYTSRTELSTLGATATAIEDLNGDGHLDILFSNFHDDTSNDTNSYIYWGAESNAYSSKTELATHASYDNSIADLNGDGFLDIVFSNFRKDFSNNTNSFIYWGDSSTPYESVMELETHGAYGNTIYDINGDGFLDIIFSNESNGSEYDINSYIYWGAAVNPYTSRTELATMGSVANAISDLNNDGYPDIVFSNYYNGSTRVTNSYVYWGDVTNSYSSMTELETMGAVGVSLGSMSALSQSYIPPIPEPTSCVLFLIWIIPYAAAKYRNNT